MKVQTNTRINKKIMTYRIACYGILFVVATPLSRVFFKGGNPTPPISQFMRPLSTRWQVDRGIRSG